MVFDDFLCTGARQPEGDPVLLRGRGNYDRGHRHQQRSALVPRGRPAAVPPGDTKAGRRARPISTCAAAPWR